MGGEEGEDDPVMLDERGDVVTKDEMEARAKEPDKKDEALAGERDEAKEAAKVDEERKAQHAEHSVSSGFGKKRKAVKVVGGDDPNLKPEIDADEEDGPTKSLTESTNDLKDMVAQQKDDATKEAAAAPAIKKGKRKKLKLSFDEAD